MQNDVAEAELLEGDDAVWSLAWCWVLQSPLCEFEACHVRKLTAGQAMVGKSDIDNQLNISFARKKNTDYHFQILDELYLTGQQEKQKDQTLPLQACTVDLL